MAISSEPVIPGQKKQIKWSNIALGGIMNMFEVTTLGQPLEVVKTQMASQRGDTMSQALKKVWSRGGVLGFYQGLIPWAWIEASTKGAVLLFAAAEIETAAMGAGLGPASAGLLGGMGGGIAQAYATVGFCTCMKTAEITRSKLAVGGVEPPSTFKLFMDMWRKDGIRGINKGVNAVALRQMTNWGSRMGFARLAENSIRDARGIPAGERLSTLDRVAASALGGALGCWNQPIEVVRVEMQSMAKNSGPDRPLKPTIGNTLAYIYKENGVKGLYRGVTPRIGLGIWQTVCMVSFADVVKEWLEGKK
ncbi:Yhm2p [Sporobolomyces salmoneus]|uniref:Yhm2p n=1 Tax=Sporobolomyces salmoneus TaxID=183962 RepID=UPI00316F9986